MTTDPTEESIPKIKGWPQIVDLNGKQMRIIRMESGRTDRTLCWTCGTEEHYETVTLTLIDEESFTETRHRR